LFHADGQTDTTKLTVAFRNFSKSTQRGINKDTFLDTGSVNPSNADLIPICHLLALLGAHRVLHVSKIMVKYIIITIIFCFQI